MNECLHVNLVREANIEAKGKIWICKQCGHLFNITPVSFAPVQDQPPDNPPGH